MPVPWRKMEDYAVKAGILAFFSTWEGEFERRLLTSVIGTYILASYSFFFPCRFQGVSRVTRSS
jgi:hypothetical protein